MPKLAGTRSGEMSQLLVALNGIEVGILEKARSGAMTFQYLKEWVNRPGARAISLSLPLTLAPYKGEKVYNFFDNLLPDSDTLRARMQARRSEERRVGKECRSGGSPW